MFEAQHLYIDGQWTEPVDGTVQDLIDPATGRPSGRVTLGGVADAERAIRAARGAFPAFSTTSVAERGELLEAIGAEYARRAEDMAEAVTADLGSPIQISRTLHVQAAQPQFQHAAEALGRIEFVARRGSTWVRRESIGVCTLITPWNFPALQPAGKVASAIAAGCTVVLKPAQLSARTALLLAEILDTAGVPAGVVNVVLGRGSDLGDVLNSHPEVDMVSFTGSGPVAEGVAGAAAPTAKRLVTELGGKSAQIVLPDADLNMAVETAVFYGIGNSGQICGASSRTLVPRERLEEFLSLLTARVNELKVGDPRAEETFLGPVVSAEQWDTVQDYIGQGIDAGTRLVTGGPGKPALPDELAGGHFVKPTVFADVTNDMTIAREEIFGPVLSVIAYDTVDEALRIANDSPFGLCGYITSADPEGARAVAEQMRTGYVLINDAAFDFNTAWGGYKQSGNGREWAEFGISEYLETKSIVGVVP
ncbi:aldehyde dehydrogenase family protein [Nocardiopsis sp. HNM0947]|uniref:Aldehyde dehydrogenase family protein n=1 Tax=Nocardiopsis coralli TaxID=2772213 RepID=A0ABR9P023_9ACTN|nr:aldehyde dehydrogenase family protein [Nocardiopsis coralli]MBE2997188.1 aldehyde dehydrogenase family protein [Nocardiopsis coralli]